jgi:D-serine deaminase-like pyridoxal phosphate-dependent protein
MKPRCILIEERIRKNLFSMAKKAREAGAVFRPHVKTAQNRSISYLYKEAGVRNIAVSSVSMAEYYAQDQWDSILIAFPLNFLELDAIQSLSRQHRIIVSVENLEGLKAASKLSVEIALIIDSGYGRTGLVWSDKPRFDEIITKKNLISMLTTHSGQSYLFRGPAERETEELLKYTAYRMNEVRKFLDLPHVPISFGDTPSCARAKPGALDFFDELRPGNFVFYDAMQYLYGACGVGDIGMYVEVPVVAVHPERKTVVVYGGSVHLSAQFVEMESEGSLKKIYGLILTQDLSGILENSYIFSLSQEHGLIHWESGTFPRLGDVLKIMPVHSCLIPPLLGNQTFLEHEDLSRILAVP